HGSILCCGPRAVPLGPTGAVIKDNPPAPPVHSPPSRPIPDRDPPRPSVMHSSMDASARMGDMTSPATTPLPLPWHDPAPRSAARRLAAETARAIVEGRVDAGDLLTEVQLAEEAG